jgi:hypothetical protein
MDAAKRERTLDLAVQMLGADAFNRLVGSVAATREQGRLRFWQEELLAKLSAATGERITDVEGFLDIFDDAALQSGSQPAPTRQSDDAVRVIPQRGVAERVVEVIFFRWWAGLPCGLLVLGLTVGYVYACIQDSKYMFAAVGALLGGMIGIMLLWSAVMDLFGKFKDDSPHEDELKNDRRTRLWPTLSIAGR